MISLGWAKDASYDVFLLLVAVNSRYFVRELSISKIVLLDFPFATSFLASNTHYGNFWNLSASSWVIRGT